MITKQELEFNKAFLVALLSTVPYEGSETFKDELFCLQSYFGLDGIPFDRLQICYPSDGDKFMKYVEELKQYVK